MIVAEPGRLRDGLQALLVSFRVLVEPAVFVDDGESALEAIRKGPPDLVILDSHLFGEAAPGFVRAVKETQTEAYCIAVVDRLGQFQPLLDAGADQVLLKGFSAAELSAAVEKVLAYFQDREASTEVTD